MLFYPGRVHLFRCLVSLAVVWMVSPLGATAQAAEGGQPTWAQVHASLAGPTGGLRVVGAGSGPARSVRVLVAASGSLTDGWMSDGRNTEIGMQIGVNWSPTPWLEVYGATRAWSNSSITLDRSHVQYPTRTWLGAKAFVAPAAWVFVGGDVRVQAPMNGAADVRRVYAGTSVGLRANVSADLREHPSVALPLVFRVSAGYLFENSARTVAFWERANYDALADAPDQGLRPLEAEDRHLVSRAQRFGWRLDRVDTVTLGFGVEAPLVLLGSTVMVSPIAEWVIDAPVNRQGFSCPEAPSDGVDGCLGPDRPWLRQAAIVGARVSPVGARLAVTVASEVGITGVRGTSQEMYAQAPYRVWVGLGYVTDVSKAR